MWLIRWLVLIAVFELAGCTIAAGFYATNSKKTIELPLDGLILEKLLEYKAGEIVAKKEGKRE